MSLNRLLIIIGVVVLLGTGGVQYYQYACSPEGRARTIFAQVRGDSAGLRAWMLKHGLIRKEVRPEDVEKRPFISTDVAYYSVHNWMRVAEGPVFERLVQLGPRALAGRDRGIIRH